MSTPTSVTNSPWDIVLEHVMEHIKRGKVVNTGSINWATHPAPDPEYFNSTGPGGWIYPISDEFPQGDLANGFNSQFLFGISVYLPQSGGISSKKHAIRTIAWNVLQLIAHYISKRPSRLPNTMTWESMRVVKVQFPAHSDGNRLMEMVVITCLAKFRTVIPRAP